MVEGVVVANSLTGPPADACRSALAAAAPPPDARHLGEVG
jgi:hypothetical protein